MGIWRPTWAAVKLFFHATKSRKETEDYELWVAMSFPYLLVCLHIFCDFAIHLWDRCITKNLSLVICKVLKVLDRFTTATQQDDGERRMGLWPWWSPPLITSRYKREADWCTKDTTVLMAFRTLAAALSHTNLKVGVAGELGAVCKFEIPLLCACLTKCRFIA